LLSVFSYWRLEPQAKMRDVILAIRYIKKIVTYNISEIYFATVPPALVTNYIHKEVGRGQGWKDRSA
jgi:hypothetical protein